MVSSETTAEEFVNLAESLTEELGETSDVTASAAHRLADLTFALGDAGLLSTHSIETLGRALGVLTAVASRADTACVFQACRLMRICPSPNQHAGGRR
jgi:hypothetical protein